MPGSAHTPEPLSSLTMAILIALADEDLHGYALMQEIEDQSGGALRPGTGSLYTALQRLMDDGLIGESEDRPRPDEDQRRRFYTLTEEGRRAARLEAARMARVLRTAHERRLTVERPAEPAS